MYTHINIIMYVMYYIMILLAVVATTVPAATQNRESDEAQILIMVMLFIQVKTLA